MNQNICEILSKLVTMYDNNNNKFKSNAIKKAIYNINNYEGLIESGQIAKENIKGIGPNKAFKLIQDAITIERLPLDKEDVAILKHLQGRRLFTLPLSPVTQRPQCGRWWTARPSMSKVALMLRKYNLHTTVDEIQNSFFRLPHTIVFY